MVIEAYVQAKQSWYQGNSSRDNKDTATVYAQDKDGAYFLYDMECSKEDFDKLTPGTKIKVTGYKAEWSGEEGSDLYFKVSLNGNTYTFTVESYLCGADTEVYKAVKALEIGQTVDLKGFLYWYNGVNPHISSITIWAVRFFIRLELPSSPCGHIAFLW